MHSFRPYIVRIHTYSPQGKHTGAVEGGSFQTSAEARDRVIKLEPTALGLVSRGGSYSIAIYKLQAVAELPRQVKE